jgi:HAD superfamily 5'-nucleotidase-like hydrolase
MSDFLFPKGAPQRGVFCNRTLNLRSLGAIGYDMDYTLIQYKVVEWETAAFNHARDRLQRDGWPVEELRFEPGLMIQGLIVDLDTGNLLKVNRFGFVKTAFHGTKPLDYDLQRKSYSRIVVDHREPRFIFLSTLFSLSEASLYANLVDLMDSDQLPMVADYSELYRRVRAAIDGAHAEGLLKAEILADLDRYVDSDPQTAEALLDQKQAGKKLMLITNSDWPYTRRLMAHGLDPHLPDGMTWRELFDLVIVSSRKPDFFTSRSPLLEVVDDEGLLRPAEGKPEKGKVYFGGNAAKVEAALGLAGDRILYVGDHFFGDVHATKSTMRWRTALVVRELESDLKAAYAFQDQADELELLMKQKVVLERRVAQMRLRIQRGQEAETLKPRLEKTRAKLTALDETIAPLARASSQTGNANWGSLMRAGNDKSYLADYVERHADVYTSRVSNLLFNTPFAYYRSARGSLPHDVPFSDD